MNCWKCCQPVAHDSVKIGFRASCSHCGVDLHTCVNCRYYSIGKPNDCMVPGTDRIRDREAYNFCEEFRPRIEHPKPEGKSKNFDSLFKE